MRRTRNGIVFIFAVLLCVSAWAGEGQDMSKVVGPSACMTCHSEEHKVWTQTKHNALFKKFHKRKNGKKIAKRMGIKRIKRSPLCLSCHYTHDDRKKIVAGVSCESCHNPAQDWIKVHNVFENASGASVDETPVQKAARILKATNAGMAHPSNIYDIAKNCYSCHSIQQEKLIEVGGHRQGWDFELVSYSQGSIRHNFVNSGKAINPEASDARKRQMYIVGRLLDLELGLRGVAKVTAHSQYAVILAQRTKKALGHVKLMLDEKIDSKSLAEAYAIGHGVALKPNNEKALSAAADKIAKINIAISKGKNKSDFPAIDKLIPKLYKGLGSNKGDK